LRVKEAQGTALSCDIAEIRRHLHAVGAGHRDGPSGAVDLGAREVQELHGAVTRLGRQGNRGQERTNGDGRCGGKTLWVREREDCRARRAGNGIGFQGKPIARLRNAALRAIYNEVGFARSLLAYELPDGRLKLIDGHLRRDFDPDMEVEVEILDVTDAEARALLLTIDPLAALAEDQSQLHERLLELTPTVNPDLRTVWEAAAAGVLTQVPDVPHREVEMGPRQFLVLITCKDEKEQVGLLERFIGEGLECRALLA
jgi:hypothetical protein